MKNFIYLLVVLLFLGCSPKLSSSWTKPEYTKRSFTKIAIVGISQNMKARTAFERTAADLLKDQGISVVEGVTVFPPNMNSKNKEGLIAKIKENKLDGIITMSLIDSNESQRYQPGELQDVDLGYYRVGKYLVRRYTAIETPGYYVPSKSYLIEAVLYDLKGNLDSEKSLVWRGQSKLVDPSSIESAAKSFTRAMVGHLINEGIITR